ncbi:MerR family transcriptional regulator [Lederbergia lenta]|uniref:DNA-binding protein n=1 Tax=Lederbergia lenta TaxID=1467 RepID=A0A2X4VQI9_LEDLE|nr:hypothetical protein [Lederbergia lenta]MCM3112302.1 hypothetical protein [Lederbergia lenta]MEC2326522.1 hypothetical protein [Lederbergia lenta]SQI53233.1 DNA-binding protein [Lederbergia lenta]
MEQHIFSSEAAKRVGIGVSTLRNYAAVLEGKGYRFERGTNNGRIFHGKDIQLITALIEKITKESMTIEYAAEIILSETGMEIEQIVHPDQEREDELAKLHEQIRQLEERQSKFSDINNKLMLRVERLTEKIEERERDQALFQRLENSRNKKKRNGIAFLRPLTTLAGKR